MLKRIISYLLKKSQNIKSQNVKYQKENIIIGSNCTLPYKKLYIGFGTTIGDNAYIATRENASVRIGKYCAIAHNLRIRPINHYIGYINLQHRFQKKYNFPELYDVKGPITIGNKLRRTCIVYNHSMTNKIVNFNYVH